MKLSNVLIKPMITEKSVALSQAYNRYIFEVTMEASKGSVADDIKSFFGVDVVEVRTIVMPGKSKRLGKTNRYSVRKNWKKAIVTVKSGQKIDFSAEGK